MSEVQKLEEEFLSRLKRAWAYIPGAFAMQLFYFKIKIAILIISK